MTKNGKAEFRRFYQTYTIFMNFVWKNYYINMPLSRSAEIKNCLGKYAELFNNLKKVDRSYMNMVHSSAIRILLSKNNLYISFLLPESKTFGNE